ncbi:MAG: pyridoxamine 5'-phosphate oxidase family protein [Microbacterium sp.]
MSWSVQDGAVPDDPFEMLAEWAPSNDDPSRPLAVVSTVDASGMPDARTVLLTSVMEEAVTFHTDSRSRKVEQLRTNPVAAFVVRWEERGRQLVLRGTVAETPAEEQAASFARRSRYLQLLAWLNTDALAAQPRAERERAWAVFDAAEPSPSAPDSWIGFALTPVEATFWEASPDGPSHRARYRRTSGTWSHSFLPG